MGYDAELDEVVEELGRVGETDLYGEVHRYDGGLEKLSIYRVVGKNKDKRRQVLRASFAEVVELGEFMVEFSATHGTGGA